MCVHFMCCSLPVTNLVANSGPSQQSGKLSELQSSFQSVYGLASNTESSPVFSQALSLLSPVAWLRSSSAISQVIGTSPCYRRISRAAFIKLASKHDNRRAAAPPLATGTAVLQKQTSVRDFCSPLVQCGLLHSDGIHRGRLAVRQGPKDARDQGFVLWKPLTGVIG